MYLYVDCIAERGGGGLGVKCFKATSLRFS